MTLSKKIFQKKLLTWYQASKRDLPWRKTKDPYKILVSEIMLQQTQVDTVIPYYERWLKRFPDFKTLAIAEEPEVLKFWQGLGYYRRAKMLHRNAQEVHTKYGGQLPKDPDSLLLLPGIGKYTAGAVASIAYDIKAPLLDGNVIRILTRIFAVAENTSEKKTLDKLWEIAANLVPETSAGDFNQALMELGATVCFPRSPNCVACPVSKLCRAFQSGKPEAYPVKTANAKTTKLKEFAFFLKDEKNRLLVKKQKKGERWADLWTLPHFPEFQTGLKILKLRKSDLKKIRTDKHGFTRYQITLDTFVLTRPFKVSEEESHYQWMTAEELRKSTFPSVYQKILDGAFDVAL